MSQPHHTSSLTSFLQFFRNAVTPLAVIRNLPAYFDPDERRAVVHSVIVGIVVWAVVFTLKNSVHSMFEAMLHWVAHLTSVVFVLLPLVLGALLTTLVVRYRSSQIHYRDAEGHVHELVDVEGDGLERAIALYHASKPQFEQALLGKEGVDVRWEMPTLSLAARKFIGTLSTLGSGGSGGLEASVTLIGESVAAGLFKPRLAVDKVRERAGITERLWQWLTHAEPEDLQTAQLGGIAAAVATLFGTPFAAAFFATEVLHQRRPVIEKLVYSLIPALIAVFLTNLFSDGHTTLFVVGPPTSPPTTLIYYTATVVVAIVISLVSQYFILLRSSCEQAFHTAFPNIWLRHVTGAVLTGIIALIAVGLTGESLTLVLGPGEAPVNAALAGELSIWVAVIALVAKILATLATVSSGGSAGLLVPSVFFGTMVAAALAPFFALPPVTLIAPAMAASLVSIVNVPLAATLFTVELYGEAYMVPALVTLVICLILTSDNSLYRTQRDPEEQHGILPGFGVRRVKVPLAWAGRTLVDLQLRNRFGVTVIGLVEQRVKQDHVRLNPSRDFPLHTTDILIVLGRDADLETFAEALIAEDSDASTQDESTSQNPSNPSNPSNSGGGTAMPEIGIYEAMSTLRAVRRLRPDPIPADVLRRVLEAATWAPTGGNRLPWRIVAVKDAAKKERLGVLYREVWEAFSKQYAAGLATLSDDVREKQERMVRAGDYLAAHFEQSPVICIFCFNPQDMAITDAKLERPSVVGGGSVYPSVENLLLACRAEGLGCTLTTLLCMREPAVKELLNIPDGWGTAAAIPIGYPIHRGHGPISRRPVEELAYTDSWGEPLG